MVLEAEYTTSVSSITVTLLLLLFTQRILTSRMITCSGGVSGYTEGPSEYCQDGTVTHLNYNRLL